MFVANGIKMAKSKRTKKYNPFKANKSGISDILETVFIIGGTMLDGYTMEYSSKAFDHKDSKPLLDRVDDNVTTASIINALGTRKRAWSAIAISISKGTDGKVFFDHIGKNIPGFHLPSDDFITEEVHKLKVKVVEKANDKYLKSVFTVAMPKSEVNNATFDFVAEQLVYNKLALGAADDETALQLFKLKLLTDQDYASKLKEAGIWNDLGKLIKATIIGF